MMKVGHERETVFQFLVVLKDQILPDLVGPKLRRILIKILEKVGFISIHLSVVQSRIITGENIQLFL